MHILCFLLLLCDLQRKLQYFGVFFLFAGRRPRQPSRLTQPSAVSDSATPPPSGPRAPRPRPRPRLMGQPQEQRAVRRKRRAPTIVETREERALRGRARRQLRGLTLDPGRGVAPDSRGARACACACGTCACACARRARPLAAARLGVATVNDHFLGTGTRCLSSSRATASGGAFTIASW